MIDEGQTVPSVLIPGAPRFQVIPDEVLQRIHGAALEMLVDPGVEIQTEEARGLLLAGGCSAVGENVISIPSTLVEDSIASAPKTFVVYDRNGEEACRLGEGRAHFGIGVTSLNYEDPESGEVREFTVGDFASLARLADALENLDFIASPGVARSTPEMPQCIVNQREFLAMTTNTTKPIMPLIANANALSDIYEMAAVIAGGRDQLRERPFVVPYLNSVSPLQFGVETLDKLLLAADWGMPVVCQAAATLGATGPMSVAGTAALSAAETLAGLVVCQLRRKGTPYLAGSMPMGMDMRSGNVTGGGAPGSLLYYAGVALGRYWGIPQVGSGGATDSKIPDEQASAEAANSIFVDIMLGSDMNFDAGAMEAGLTTSATLAVMCDEIIGNTRGIVEGIATDDEQLAVDVVRRVGIGGLYLGDEHTLRHFREVMPPPLMSWETRLEWEAGGSKTLRERAREVAVQLISTHETEKLSDGVLAAMEEIVLSRKAQAPVEEDD
jgi:trimethylamine--corrinoid protein Co-methyltransferase